MSPRALARIAGLLYLVNILAGAFAIGYVTSNGPLFRAGIAAHLAVTLTNVPLALIFYELFKVVNRRAAILVVLFTVVATAVEAAGVAYQLARLSFDGATAAYDVSTAFFAGYAIALGYLVYSSTFMPKAIGVLMVIDGVAYLTNSFVAILAPDFATHLVPYIQLPILLGEGSLSFWLLIYGVNARRWDELARAPGRRA